MTEGDSGVDTCSESNESNSMSIGSPSRSDEDKVRYLWILMGYINKMYSFILFIKYVYDFNCQK